MRLSVSIALLTAILTVRASAEPVPLAYFYLPPYSYMQDGHPEGPAIDLARSIAEGLNVVFRPDLVPIRRLAFEAAKSPLIIAAIMRTPERETHYQWIGKLCTDAFVMATRASSPAIDTLEEARKLRLIAVAAGATNETYLRERDFTNLDPAAEIQLEVRRLAEGHDDAWFAPRAGALHAWKVAGYDPAQLRFGAPIVVLPVWMAASNSVAPDLVEALRTRFAEKVKDGSVAAATGCSD